MGKKKVEKIFDEYAERYQTGAFAPSKVRTRAAMGFADKITWHFLTKYLPKRKSVEILDAGGGEGFWSQRLVELGYHNIVVMDISRGMLEEAAKRFAKLGKEHRVKLVKSDITDMKEFETCHFDFVFSQYDAVSYCMRPANAMQELSRVAKKGAHVVVSLDTKFRRVSELIEAGQINEAERLLNTNVCYEFDFPQYNLTWEELSEYFVKAGLKVVEVIGAPVFMHQVDEQVRRKLEEDKQVRDRLLQIELAHCTDRSLVNFAGHLQMVGRKV